MWIACVAIRYHINLKTNGANCNCFSFIFVCSSESDFGMVSTFDRISLGFSWARVHVQKSWNLIIVFHLYAWDYRTDTLLRSPSIYTFMCAQLFQCVSFCLFCFVLFMLAENKLKRMNERQHQLQPQLLLFTLSHLVSGEKSSHTFRVFFISTQLIYSVFDFVYMRMLACICAQIRLY